MQKKAPTSLSLLSLRKNYTHPHELYAALRTQNGLFFDNASQSWLATDYKVVTTVLDDPRFISGLSSATGTSSAQMSSVSKQMLFMDGDHHHRAQNVMLRPLSQMVKRMPDAIRTFVRQSLAQQLPHQTIDLVKDYAAPISLLTIAHVLGIPTHDYAFLLQLECWSDTFGDATSGYFRGNMQDIGKLETYFSQLIAEKRRSPGNDLLSAFIEAADIFQDEEDLVANCMMIFAAGRITTKKLLGNGISLLLPHWQEYQDTFQAQPRFARMLGEELLRMVTPTRCLLREAREDVNLSGACAGQPVVRKGQRVFLFLEAADYDPVCFSEPMQFDPHRRPNKHIAFGYGPHQCPGATLARVEIQIALEEILTLPQLRAKPGTCPVWHTNPNLGGFTSNPTVFG